MRPSHRLLAAITCAAPWTTVPARADDPDPAVRRLLGRTLEQYPQRSYKDIELGSRFDAVDSRTTLDSIETNAPHVLRSSRRVGEDFIFAADRTLVCYAKTYVGGPDDYLEKLVRVFGKTD